jgi:8-oxo-dGTP pyrophosphatase MutT (NUDIX family)
MIFKRGHWDLPKGKVDPGETWEECAIREVIEETGITNLELIKFITTTYHTYEHNGSIILKPSHWFLMKTTSNQMLIPQREEDITEVKWVALSEISNHAEQSFGTIRDLLQLNELFT